MQTVIDWSATANITLPIDTSLSKVRQLSWPKFMLPIKSFQFKMCQLAVTDVFHYQCTRDVNKCGFHVEHLSFN